jgi:hypothetical protein
MKHDNYSSSCNLLRQVSAISRSHWMQCSKQLNADEMSTIFSQLLSIDTGGIIIRLV